VLRIIPLPDQKLAAKCSTNSPDIATLWRSRNSAHNTLISIAYPGAPAAKLQMKQSRG
jgi:hypothetical protein